MTLVSSATPVLAPAANRRWLLWLVLATAAAVLTSGAYWGYSRVTAPAPSNLVGAKFYPVVPVEMQFKVNKDGELQAVNNIDIQCLVEGGSTIVQLVKEGAMVKKGDVLVILDSSAIRQKMDDAQLLLQSSEADVTT